MLLRTAFPLFMLVWAWLGLLTACAPASEGSRATPPSSESSTSMTASDFVSVTYAVGNPAFNGRTTIELAASGAARVSVEQGDNTRTFTQQFSEEELTLWVQQLLTVNPCELQAQRQDGKPGEDQVEFRLEQRATNCELRFWINERWDQAGLRQLVDLFRSLANTVSDGEL